MKSIASECSLGGVSKLCITVGGEMGKTMSTTCSNHETNTVLPSLAEEMPSKKGPPLTSNGEPGGFERKEELELGPFLQRRQVF